MVAGANSDHATHVEQVQLIAGSYSFRNIAHKTLQRAPASQHTEQHVAGIDFGETSGGQLEHVVSGAVSQRSHHDHVTGARMTWTMQ